MENSNTTQVESQVSDYVALLKPRVMTLVVFTGLCGLLLAPGSIHPFLGAVAIAALAIGAGAAGAVNMWYDRDIDAVMTRTQKRPLPAGLLEPANGLAFALVLSLLAVLLMGLAVNWVAAGLLACANFFYSIIYTMWLKRRTPQNIVIGGAAGAFPPMIGWAAVTGDVSLASLVLFALIFFWTPPHFWALALYSSTDYKRAGVPMLPCVVGDRSTKIQMLIYTLVLWPLGVLPTVLGVSGYVYLGIACVLNTLFVIAALRVLRETEGYKAARQMFAYSIFYLFALFTALVLDGVSLHAAF